MRAIGFEVVCSRGHTFEAMVLDARLACCQPRMAADAGGACCTCCCCRALATGPLSALFSSCSAHLHRRKASS